MLSEAKHLFRILRFAQNDDTAVDYHVGISSLLVMTNMFITASMHSSQ